MHTSYSERAHEIYVQPEAATKELPDISDYESLDDAHLLALVETVRPSIYAHINVLINKATPLITHDIRDFFNCHTRSLLGLERFIAESYQAAVYDLGQSPEMHGLCESTDELLEVLRHARIRGLYDPITALTESPRTLELTLRGCRTGIQSSVRSLDYLYNAIRDGEFDADPYALAANPDAKEFLVSVSMSIAKRVGIQDLAGLFRLLSGDDNPFSGRVPTNFEALQVSSEAPYRVRLMSHIKAVRAKRDEINTQLHNYDAYMLEPLTCPAVVGMGGVEPIPDMVSFVMSRADEVRAFDLGPLPRLDTSV